MGRRSLTGCRLQFHLAHNIHIFIQLMVNEVSGCRVGCRVLDCERQLFAVVRGIPCAQPPFIIIRCGSVWFTPFAILCSLSGLSSFVVPCSLTCDGGQGCYEPMTALRWAGGPPRDLECVACESAVVAL